MPAPAPGPVEDASAVAAGDGPGIGGISAEHAQDDGAPASGSRMKLITALGAIAAFAAAGGAGYLVSQQDATAPSGAAHLSIRIPGTPVRQRAADGREIITTTAEVANGGTAPGRMPDMKATVRTSDGRVVREWRVTPPAGEIAPKNVRSVEIGTAGADMPAGPLRLDVDMVEREHR